MPPVDDTHQGSSELEMRSGVAQTVVLGERTAPRDDIEDQAAKNAAKESAKRMRAMMGLPSEEEDAQVAAEEGGPVTAEEQAKPESAPVEQPRDEQGRFASPTPPDPAQAPAKPAERPVRELAPDDLVAIKVHGQIQNVRWEDVQRNIQIEAAARQNLERATALKREWEARNQNPTPNAAPQIQNQPTNDPQAPIRELAKGIAFGNEDDIATALQKFIGTQPTTPAAATPEIMQVVEHRLAVMQQQADARSDVETFAREHPDIAQDADFQQLVAARTQKAMTDDLLATGRLDVNLLQTLTPLELGQLHRQARGMFPQVVRPTIAILRNAANEVKTRFAAPTSAQPNPAIQARLDAKRSAPAPVNAATARVPAPQPARAPTASELIEQERAARGLRTHK